MGKELLLCKYNYDGLGHCAFRGYHGEYCVEGPCKNCEYVRYKVALRARSGWLEVIMAWLLNIARDVIMKSLHLEQLSIVVIVVQKWRMGDETVC